MYMTRNCTLVGGYVGFSRKACGEQLMHFECILVQTKINSLQDQDF